MCHTQSVQTDEAGHVYIHYSKEEQEGSQSGMTNSFIEHAEQSRITIRYD